MSADSENWPPPDDPSVFESLCLDLWREIWHDPGAQKNGRSGQAQAVEPMRVSMEMAVEQKDWNNAARYAGNLSQLELTLGDVAAAVRDVEQSVDLADRSGDAFLRMALRTALADALYQAGRHDDALARFREAEAMQAERQPAYPLLYSLQGFRYCDLLLAGAERAAWQAADAGARSRHDAGAACREVERRGQKMLEWRVPGDSILDIALDHLTLGRAGLYRSILERPDRSRPEDPGSEIEQAVDGLRRAGQLHYLPLGLLTRAWWRRRSGDAAGAVADLDEAWEIAERGPMPLFLADVQLCRARLFGDRSALAQARRLIEGHGYGRRLGELGDAEAGLVGVTG